MNSISKLLSTDGFIQVNKSLIKKLGLHEAIMIGELCAEYNYWEGKNKLEDNSFYSTRENIEENTGLSEHYQRKALKTLKDNDIIEIIKKGLPAKNYYKINFDKILMILSSSCQRRKELDTENIDINNNKQINIKNKKNNSKELLQNSNFNFGKQKSKKENLFTKCVSLIDTYDFSRREEIRKLLIEYLQFRLSVKDKPLYTNMWKGMLNKLDKLHQEGYGYEPIIDYCLERGYLSFYPPTGCYTDINDKPWEEGVKSDGYTDEEKRELEKREQEMMARGERVWY